jgi:hypothetical protein
VRTVNASPKPTTSPSSAIVAPYGDRSTLYDALVGPSVSDETRRAHSKRLSANAEPLPEDRWHGISVACGYLGLVAGFGCVAAAIL